jgi:precorrin-6B methylase 2
MSYTSTYNHNSILLMDNILTHPSSRAIAIDTFDKIFDSDPEQIFRENVRRSGHSSKVTVIKGYSQQKMRDLEAAEAL